ncbi:MAG: NUDIX domain-containing protein [Treponema sp.]|jgi:isopentenyldiphosphate isomerase|nr:NUDIX domain-containing protein [Treponema sp.]
MEYWDLYNSNREKINKLHLRGNSLNSGEYHIVVHIWIVNDQNKIILTQRHPEKTYPYKWECTGGSIIAGENSIDGALREVYEEIGIKLNKNNGKLIKTLIRENDFCDIWLFKENIDIEKIKLQEDEVINIKMATIEEIKEMIKDKKIAEPLICNIKLLEKEIKQIAKGTSGYK